MLKNFRLSLGRMPKELMLIGCMLTIVEGILWYFLPIYFEERLSSMLLVGVVISAYSAGRLVVSLPAGDITDKIGRKFMFVLGVAGFFASMIFLFFDGFFYFSLFMLLFGAFTTIYGIPAHASLLDHITKRDVPIVMGIADVLSNFGWGFGPVIAGVLLLYLNVPSFFSAVVIILLGVSLFSLTAFPGKLHLRMRDFKRSKSVLIKDRIYTGQLLRLAKLGRPLLAILTFSFAFGFWEYAIWTFEPIWANEMGASLLLGALILMLDNIPYMPASLVAGMVTNRLGIKKMFIIGAAFVLLGQSFFMFSQSLATLALTLVVTPIGISFMGIPMDTWTKRHVKDNLYGQVTGIDSMIYDIGGVIAPIVVGIMAATSDAASIIYVTFAFFVLSIATLMFAFVIKR